MYLGDVEQVRQRFERVGAAAGCCDDVGESGGTLVPSLPVNSSPTLLSTMTVGAEPGSRKSGPGEIPKTLSVSRAPVAPGGLWWNGSQCGRLDVWEWRAALEADLWFFQPSGCSQRITSLAGSISQRPYPRARTRPLPDLASQSRGGHSHSAPCERQSSFDVRPRSFAGLSAPGIATGHNTDGGRGLDAWWVEGQTLLGLASQAAASG